MSIIKKFRRISNLKLDAPACATYLRPPKHGLRVGGSRFGEGRRSSNSDEGARYKS
jgi:hypothetical protein